MKECFIEAEEAWEAEIHYYYYDDYAYWPVIGQFLTNSQSECANHNGAKSNSSFVQLFPDLFH